MSDSSDKNEVYRQTPYVIQAAQSGNSETLKHLTNDGECDLTDRGHIVLSRSRLNSVTSNVIGAAAYYGKPKMLSRLLQILSDAEHINDKATETKDACQSKCCTFKPEYTGYTPLMLAVVSPNCDLECIKTLLSNKADYSTIEKTTGNNILHLCAERCPSDKVFEYLFKNLKIDLFQRNAAGETPLSICQNLKKANRIKIAEEVQAIFDNSE